MLYESEVEQKTRKCGYSINVTAFWDIAPCSLEVDQRFRDVYCRRHQGDHHDDEGSMYLWNTSVLQWDCTALYPRRLSSSYSPWGPEISHGCSTPIDWETKLVFQYLLKLFLFKIRIKIIRKTKYKYYLMHEELWNSVHHTTIFI
jgi:hypothetical protein